MRRVFLAAALAALVGCNPSTNPKSSASMAKATDSKSPDAQSAEKKPAESTSTDAKTGDQNVATPITISTVSLAQFEKAIAAHKGQVVVIDFWADYCLPCKQHFHHLVEMHEKYGPRGLVCISASIDEAEAKDRCLKFLTRKNARFENYLIDEKIGVVNDRWDFSAIPAVVVYGVDGKLARAFTWDDPDNQFTYADVEKYAVGLLEKK